MYKLKNNNWISFTNLNKEMKLIKLVNEFQKINEKWI